MKTINVNYEDESGIQHQYAFFEDHNIGHIKLLGCIHRQKHYEQPSTITSAYIIHSGATVPIVPEYVKDQVLKVATLKVFEDGYTKQEDKL